MPRTDDELIKRHFSGRAINFDKAEVKLKERGWTSGWGEIYRSPCGKVYKGLLLALAIQEELEGIRCAKEVLQKQDEEVLLEEPVKIKKAPKAKKQKTKAEGTIAAIKARSLKKKLPFDLDLHVQDLQDIFDKGVCQLTGFRFQEGYRNAFMPSVDRIIPEKGYIWENIRVIVWAANCAMNCWGEEVLLQIADAIRENKK